MQDYRKLRAWHLADALTNRIRESLPIRLSVRSPGLRGQTIRAARSIASNLVEGCGRERRTDFLHFIDIALGSAIELEDHLGEARDAQMLSEALHKRHTQDLITVKKMLRALRRAVQHAVALEEDASRDEKQRKKKRV